MDYALVRLRRALFPWYGGRQVTAISIRHLWKEYGDQIVLEDINLEFAPRSFIALVGPRAAARPPSCASC